MKIGPIDLDREILIIAEIGNNHEGDVALAEEMILLAADAGAQAVKFQTIIPEGLVSPNQKSRLAQLRRFQLQPEEYGRLADAAEKVGVMFISTPFSLDAVSLLEALVIAYKVASGDNDYVALLDAVAQTGRPVLVSTGMTDQEGAMRARDVVRGTWAQSGINPGLVLMHCVSAYPTPPAEANLRAIRSLAALGETVGYSDHTLGINAAALAVALGARVIEKHFTIDKNQSDFRDHALSADPSELRSLVQLVRETNEMLGEGSKLTMPSEEAVAKVARRSAHSARDLPAGHVLETTDIAWLRPGTGISQGQQDLLVGRRLKQPVSAWQILSAEAVE